MKQSRRLAALMAATAIMAAVGAIGAEAQAQGLSVAGSASSQHLRTGPKPPKPKPTPKPKPPRHCFDVDSAVKDPDKYVSVICNGRVYVLTVREAPPAAPTPVGGWQFVGGPTNVVDATLASRNDELYVTVLTATGAVHQGVCGATEPLTTPCTFYDLPTPPA